MGGGRGGAVAGQWRQAPGRRAASPGAVEKSAYLEPARRALPRYAAAPSVPLEHSWSPNCEVPVYYYSLLPVHHSNTSSNLEYACTSARCAEVHECFMCAPREYSGGVLAYSWWTTEMHV